MKRNHPFGLTQILLTVALCMLQMHDALGCGFLELGHVHCVHQYAATSATSNGDNLCPCDHSKPNENHSKDVCNASAYTLVRTSSENFPFVFVELFLASLFDSEPFLGVDPKRTFVVESSVPLVGATIPLYLRDRCFLI